MEEKLSGRSESLEHIFSIRPEARKRLFGFNAPLGSFVGKMKVAHAIGFIGPKTLDLLDKIRLIRNAFAHAKMSVSFRTKEIADVCALLEPPESLSPYHNRTLYADNMRGLFTETCFLLAHNLQYAAIGRPKVIESKFVTFPVAENFEIVLRRKSLP